MTIPDALRGKLRIPVICAPMFTVSNPELVIAQCTAGLVGSFPALNARPAAELDVWLDRIEHGLEHARAERPSAIVAPYAVNQIVHASNARLSEDMAVCAAHRVPLVITSLQVPDRVVESVHSYGGLVFHDVISARHARRAIAAGVDGLILVCAGAGGHTGTTHPFALVAEVRSFYDGPIALSGAITRGEQVRAAELLGADFAYVGTRFIATAEANVDPDYKRMLVEASSADIVNTNLFTGVHGNYLRGSVERAGYDPAQLPSADKSRMSFDESSDDLQKVKAWRDIWGAGHGVGSIIDVAPTSEIVERMVREYGRALAHPRAWCVR